MALSMVTVTPGVTGYTNGDGSPGAGIVKFQPSYPATGGGAIIVAAPFFAQVVGGFFANPVEVVSTGSVPGLQYIVTEMITNCAPNTYTIAPTGGTFDLSTDARGGTPSPLYVLSSTVGQVGGPAGPLNSSGQIPSGQTVAKVASVAAPLGSITIGGTATVPTVAPSRTLWTPAAAGLIAATGDIATMPSQAAVTTGRLFVSPVVVDQALTANSMCVAYVSLPAATVTSAFLMVYSSTGTLLGQTADFSASFTTTASGVFLVPPLQLPITGLVAGQQIYIGMINNYTGTGPSFITTRLFGTNLSGGSSGPNVTNAIPRLLVSSGTFTSVPATMPAVNPSNTNSLVGIGLTQ